MSRDIKAANNHIGVSFNGVYVDYAEPDETHVTGGDNLDGETGFVPGVAIEGRLLGDVLVVPNVFASASFSYEFGDTNYDGHLQDLRTGMLTPYTTLSGATIVDFGVRVGVAIPLAEIAAVTPYASIGYHNWRRAGAEDTQYALNEAYSHFDVGGGLMLQVSPVHDLVLEVSGGVSAMASSAIALGEVTSVDLGNFAVVRLGGEVRYQLVRCVQLMAGYEFVTFQYGRSDTTRVAGLVVLEPDSVTRLHFVHLGAAYAF